MYQTDFLKKIPEAFPDKSTKILVYGDGDPFKADLAALGRLSLLGYTNTYVLEGGLSAWKRLGNSVSGAGKRDSSNILTGELQLDTKRTKIRWIGRNLMNQHHGEIAANNGTITIAENGDIRSGVVSVDMRAITCHDIPEKPVAAMLVEHLESIDFFDVANYPEASFEISSMAPITGSTYGKPNFRVDGILSVRGIIADLEISAIIEPIEDGYVFQTVFDFDRTQVGALYGSGSIFERLGMHLVNDLVSIDVTAIFVKA